MRFLYAVMLLFILAATALVLAFDGKILHGIARQGLAAFHPSAPGTITRSRVVEHRDSDGSTYGFEVRYAYEAGGRAYEGSQYRYGAWRSSNKRVAEDLARRFPVGAIVPVFHDPESPGDAVLVTGIQGVDLFLLLFMNPFNLVMLVGLRGVLGLLLGGDEERLGVFMRAGRVHVRLEGVSALAVGVMALGGSSFLSIFVVGFVTGFEPPLAVAVLTWGAVLTTGVVFARRQRAKLDSGDCDLILDETNRRLSLPVGAGREARLDVPWSQVTSVVLEERTEKDNEGDLVTRWCPTLVLAAPHGGKRNETLVEWSDEHKAAVLVKWLKSRLPHAQGVEKGRLSVPG
ncbi:DUF3592 domain-containing protein [Archangium violaceum]|uniref:DUF3592 domain-containing protein n=1 Tax=Archangium violaceum Cb vi76 TaxID=1406225 RepID=A0A084SWT6_9BACT|nr:DUF3592 domain-containing protein [Archangium violaceum]KFA92921.1 hypothetical protein Q664_12435 [Archangium violaceum Cb vi76]